MDSHYTYLLIDVLCILVPLLFSFHAGIRFDKQWRPFFLTCLPVAILFILWDACFTHIGIWSFNGRYVSGMYLYNLPVEEVLFFICIPYASVFTYYCFSKYYDTSAYKKTAKYFTMLLVILLLTVAIINHSRLYTSVTFILLGSQLVILLIRKVSFLPGFYLSFLIILIPFFISNGILTGSFLQEPVVAYNNNYNLGVRMHTIPVEDIFYGMLLLLLNVSGFEYFSRRCKKMPAQFSGKNY